MGYNFSKILFRSIPFPRTGLKISTSLLILSIAFSIVKSFMARPFFTSSQYNGIETVAPGLGLNEYGAANVALGRFCKKSTYNLFFLALVSLSILVIPGNILFTCVAIILPNIWH